MCRHAPQLSACLPPLLTSCSKRDVGPFLKQRELLLATCRLTACGDAHAVWPSIAKRPGALLHRYACCLYRTLHIIMRITVCYVCLFSQLDHPADTFIGRAADWQRQACSSQAARFSKAAKAAQSASDSLPSRWCSYSTTYLLFCNSGVIWLSLGAS